jgi:hypothetical protein
MDKSRACFRIGYLDIQFVKYIERLEWCMSIPVTALSKAWVFGRSLATIAGWNPAGEWMSVCCECFVLSGRGLCEGLVTRPE